MNRLVLIGLYSLTWICYITPTRSHELNKIESSFLSQIRGDLRNEDKLERCVHLWQAVEAKLIENDNLTEVWMQRVEPNQVNLTTIIELRNLIKVRRTGFGQNLLETFLDDCIKVLIQNGAIEKGKANGRSVRELELEQSNNMLLNQVKYLEEEKRNIEAASKAQDDEQKIEISKLSARLLTLEQEKIELLEGREKLVEIIQNLERGEKDLKSKIDWWKRHHNQMVERLGFCPAGSKKTHR